MLCSSCGSKGIHIGCGKLDWSTMEWDCDDCGSLQSRRNSASRAAEPSNGGLLPAIPASTSANNSLTPHSAENMTPRAAVKRPRSGGLTSTSEESSSSESDVDIVSVSDPESPTSSLTSQSRMIFSSN